MRFSRIILATFALVAVLTITGCDVVFNFFGGQRAGNQGGAGTAQATPVTPPAGAVTDYASLVSYLKAANLTVVSAGDISQPFFSVDGQVITVNGGDVQVFEYLDAAAANAEAALISPSGSSIGTTMMTWIAPPHFYKSGRLIVLYLGTDATVLNALKGALGPQIAGR